MRIQKSPRVGLVCGLILGLAASALSAENRAVPGNDGLPGPVDPLTIPEGGSPGVLDTGYQFDSGWCSGPYVDLTADAASDVTIVRWEMYFKGTVNRDVDMWWKVGSYDDSETTPGDWTYLGTVNVTPGGDGTLTTVNLGGITIPAGQTYGFKIWDGGTGGPDGPGLDLREFGTETSNSDLGMISRAYTCSEIWSDLGTLWGWQGQVIFTLGAPVPTMGPAILAILLLALLIGTLLLLRRRSPRA